MVQYSSYYITESLRLLSDAIHTSDSPMTPCQNIHKKSLDWQTMPSNKISSLKQNYPPLLGVSTKLHTFTTYPKSTKINITHQDDPLWLQWKMSPVASLCMSIFFSSPWLRDFHHTSAIALIYWTCYHHTHGNPHIYGYPWMSHPFMLPSPMR